MGRGIYWGIACLCTLAVLISSVASAAGNIVVDGGTAMQYIEPLSDLPNAGSKTGWTAHGYDTTQDNGKGDAGNGSANWQTGAYGVGYDDGDDLTTIDNDGSVYSVYTRTTFNVASAAAIQAMVLEIDYDDGYIVWLNGTEVNRSGNMVGVTAGWNAVATASHEASFNWGTPIDLSAYLGLLQNGANTLAIGVWNNAANSSDMTLRPRLTLYDTPYIAPPIHTYLTWQGDTGTTMTVNYHTGATAGQSKVYYDTVPHGGNLASYAFQATGSSHQISGLSTYVNRNIHWVELTGLTPGQTYYCVAGDPAVAITPEFKFRTIPSGDVPIRFTQGGDMGTSSAVGQLMAAAALQEPMFMAFGGDCAYENGALSAYANWDTVLNFYEDNMVTPEGYTVPMVVGIGNHEVTVGWGGSPAQAPFYYNYFAQGGSVAYFTRTFGSNMILYALDSGHTAAVTGTQSTWLSNTMAANTAYPYRFALYHVPMYPSVRSFTGDANILDVRNGWRSIFDQYGMTTALENHDHALKRAKLLKNDQPDPTGTLYIGDGCMGQSTRATDQAGYYYLERADDVQHFWLIEVPSSCVNGAQPVYTAININGGVLDRYSKRANPLTPDTLVPTGSTWKYLDNGTDQGSAWRDPAFVDTTWASGAAELGYGDAPVTTVSYGPDANNKYTTTYFRKSFTVADPSLYGHLKLRLKRDDGAVVYLNGAEVYRCNVSMTGAIAYNTLATVNVGGADENTFFDTPDIQNMLVAGTNVLAVEIHQDSLTSSDVSFDLELLAYPTTETVLSPKGATWKYLDNGTNQGIAWREAAFNDTAWASGPAELGYGDAPVTTVSFGPNSADKYETTYFRRSFTVADASIYRAYALNVLRDDGVIVYLNGTEIYRSNMPLGVPTYTTLASAAVDTFQENTYFPSPVLANILVDGTNVLAVEVHQSGVTSSDLSFDLEFVGIRGANLITASAGANGSISPSGSQSVLDGANQAFTFAPAPGYHVADVTVDCESIGAVSSYTFSDVSAPHEIDVSFAADPIIAASASSGGSISPSGNTSVVYGGSQSYTITPNACFSISDVLVDGVSVGAVGAYTFSNVTTNHTIAASFVASGPYGITASAGSGGVISSSGLSNVACGGSKSYTITPSACFAIADVLVDGVSVGAVNAYTFSNVSAPHTIAVSFSALGPYAITASAGSGGAISSSGLSNVACGGSKSYTITPAVCFAVSDVLVDGVSVGALNTYTFSNVTAAHTIAASFVPVGPYNITASAGAGGGISSSGVSSVACGGSKTYTITPNTCFGIADVLVDGVSVGAVSAYTFSNVTAPHTIAVSFTALGPYAIAASAGSGGSISANGVTNVSCGGSQSYTITPGPCHVIAGVSVDGVPQGAVSSYTFTSVSAPHTISATFSVLGPYTLSATAGPGGTISSPGFSSQACGSSKTYTITPDPGFQVSLLIVDAVVVPNANTYTFSNITANHNIQVLFEEIPAEGEGEGVVEGEGEGGTGDIIVTGPGTLIEVHAGEAHTFTVSASGGVAPLHYQWYRQIGSGPLEPIGDDAPSLSLTEIQNSDAGIYFCTVTDGVTLVTSEQALLIVLAALPWGSVSLLLLVALALLVFGMGRLSREGSSV